MEITKKGSPATSPFNADMLRLGGESHQESLDSLGETMKEIGKKLANGDPQDLSATQIEAYDLFMKMNKEWTPSIKAWAAGDMQEVDYQEVARFLSGPALHGMKFLDNQFNAIMEFLQMLGDLGIEGINEMITQVENNQNVKELQEIVNAVSGLPDEDAKPFLEFMITEQLSILRQFAHIYGVQFAQALNESSADLEALANLDYTKLIEGALQTAGKKANPEQLATLNSLAKEAVAKNIESIKVLAQGLADNENPDFLGAIQAIFLDVVQLVASYGMIDVMTKMTNSDPMSELFQTPGTPEKTSGNSRTDAE